MEWCCFYFVNDECALGCCSCLATPLGRVEWSVSLLHVHFKKYGVELTLICVLCTSICIGVYDICTCDTTSDLCKYSYRALIGISKLLLDI